MTMVVSPSGLPACSCWVLLLPACSTCRPLNRLMLCRIQQFHEPVNKGLPLICHLPVQPNFHGRALVFAIPVGQGASINEPPCQLLCGLPSENGRKVLLQCLDDRVPIRHSTPPSPVHLGFQGIRNHLWRGWYAVRVPRVAGALPRGVRGRDRNQVTGVRLVNRRVHRSGQ